MFPTFNASRDLTSDASLTDALDFFKTKVFQQINTITLATVLSVNLITRRLQIQPLINGVNTQNTPIIPPMIYDVPYGDIRGGNAGIIIDPVPGDSVIVGFCQRQIDSTKSTGASSTPSLYRYFSLQDAVVLSHWSNADPTIFLKITNTEVTIQAVSNPITITTLGNTTINATNVTINATAIATVTAPAINLNGDVIINGSLAVSGIVTAVSGPFTIDSPVVMNTTLTIDGTSFTGHTHTGVTPGPDDTGPVA